MQTAILSCEYLISPALVEKEILLEQIQGLIELNQLMNNGNLTPVLENGMIDKLIARGSYPAEGIFKNNISKCGLTEYSAKDVAKTVNSILNRALLCESEIPDRALEWRDREFVPVFSHIESDRQAELHGLIEGAATANKIEKYDLAVLFYCAINKFREVSVRGFITCAYPELGFDLPYYFDESVSIFESYKQYISSLDYYAIYARATGPDSLKFSLYVGALQRLHQKGMPLSKVSYDQIYIGTRFWESLKINQCLPDQGFAHATLDAVVDVLASYKSDRPKIFETSAGSGEARTKDRCHAYRVHVTKSGVALRLMFWIDSEENIELANVGPKQELKIHDPDFI